jgi:GntR family transcriptional regulator
MTWNISLVKGEAALPIHQQIINSVRHAISSGRLKAGDRLPPVRKLALDLDVAMNTVARAYRELDREGLTENGPGRGTFVKQLIVPQAHHWSVDATAIHILRPAITALTAMGMSRVEIAAAVEKLLSEAPLRLGIVGSSERGADKWARALKHELRDFRIEPIPVTLAELAEDPEAVVRKLEGAAFVFTLLTGYHMAREILEATGRHVVPLITQLSHQCQQDLLALPRDVRVGLVCEDIYLNSVLEVIASYAPTARVERVNLDDVAGARRLTLEVDTMVYSFAAGEIVESLPAGRARLLPLVYTLSEENSAHVRRLIAPHAPPQRVVEAAPDGPSGGGA